MTSILKKGAIAEILLLAILVSVAITTFAESPDDVGLPASNELGLVMILMYHEISAKESTWSRKPQNFRKDLEKLYGLKYRPISLRDLVNNEITTPKGLTPIVLTFDDGTLGQFQIETKAGRRVIAPESALGILESFHVEHPDFPLKATFFLHGSTPFSQPDLVDYKLNYLVEHGFDVGNHSTRHQNLSSPELQTAEKIQRALGNQSIFLKSRLTQHPEYSVDTLALCYGARPRIARLRSYLRTGVAKGQRYNHIAVVNVGAGPSFSPSDKRFTPLFLPRIRVSEKSQGSRGFVGWLEYFEKNPAERYVSDGTADVVTIPKSLLGALDDSRLKNKSIVVLSK